MARRVERTTGLPRPRPKERRDSARTFAGISWTDRRRDLTILGVAVAFAVLVGGMLLFQFYDNTVLQPRSTVLRVGDGRSPSATTPTACFLHPAESAVEHVHRAP
jgi:hypothetical protein